MYLVSVYFDEKSAKAIERYIVRIAERTGNTFMTDNHVPPHMTISAIEARQGSLLVPALERIRERIGKGTVRIVSVGLLLPYVLYLTPVLNGYLQELSGAVYDGMKNIPETKISEYYRPMQWLPHITVGKTLSREQVQTAVALLQESFAPFDAEVVRLGLAQTNPHRDIWAVNLDEVRK